MAVNLPPVSNSDPCSSPPSDEQAVTAVPPEIIARMGFSVKHRPTINPTCNYLAYGAATTTISMAANSEVAN